MFGLNNNAYARLQEDTLTGAPLTLGQFIRSPIVRLFSLSSISPSLIFPVFPHEARRPSHHHRPRARLLFFAVLYPADHQDRRGGGSTYVYHFSPLVPILTSVLCSRRQQRRPPPRLQRCFQRGRGTPSRSADSFAHPSYVFLIPPHPVPG